MLKQTNHPGNAYSQQKGNAYSKKFVASIPTFV